MPRVSIIVPMHNEEGAVDDLIKGISASAADLPAFEIIAVDDGSTDNTLQRLTSAAESFPELRILRHKKAAGQSAAVHSGVCAARAAICCTLDGDGQNPPENLPNLWNILLQDENGEVGLAAGQRVDRQDTVAKKIASRMANAIRGWILRDGTKDTGCGLKGFRTEAFLLLPYFDHMHRYLPALFSAYEWKVALVDVTHMPRTTGVSKYTNLGRAIAGVWDLLGVVWLIHRAKKATPEAVETKNA